MADFGKPPTGKRKRRIGSPPPPDDASTTLTAPEHAPAPAETKRKARAKTGRTVPFSTKVTAEFDAAFREVVFREKLKNAELLERMLEMYKKKKR